MYVTGIAVVVVVILAILMMLNVLPMTPQVVGGGFLVLCFGMGGPYLIKTA